MKKDLYTKILDQKHFLEQSEIVREYIVICNLLNIYDKHPELAKEVKAAPTPGRRLARNTLYIREQIIKCIKSYDGRPVKYGIIYRDLRFTRKCDISYYYLRIVLKKMDGIVCLGKYKGYQLKGDLADES